MKKHILITLLACAFLLNSEAQAFKKGDVMISPGFGIGTYGIGYSVGFAVPLVLNADFGVHDYVSVGAYAGFWTRKWDYGFNSNYRFTSTHFGARASFHFWQLIDTHVDADLKGDKLDIYLTPWLGYNLRSAKYDGIGTGVLSWGNRFQGGAQIGLRYFINKNIGFYAEWGGTPTSWSNWGMSFRF